MNADGRIDERDSVCQPNGGLEIRRPIAGADGQHVFQPRCMSAIDDRRRDQRQTARRPDGNENRRIPQTPISAARPVDVFVKTGEHRRATF